MGKSLLIPATCLAAAFSGTRLPPARGCCRLAAPRHSAPIHATPLCGLPRPNDIYKVFSVLGVVHLSAKFQSANRSRLHCETSKKLIGGLVSALLIESCARPYSIPQHGPGPSTSIIINTFRPTALQYNSASELTYFHGRKRAEFDTSKLPVSGCITVHPYRHPFIRRT